MYLMSGFSLLFAFLLFIGINKPAGKWLNTCLIIGTLISCSVQMILWGFNIIMLPGYLFILTSLILAVIRICHNNGRGQSRRRKAVITGTAAIWSALCIGLMYLFPQFTMPQPSGEYGIGTLAMEIIDQNRQETYTKETGDSRKIMVQLWYPTQKSNSNHCIAYPKEVGAALHSVLKMPEWLFNYFSNIKTHTVNNVEIVSTEGKFPMILYSPGNQSTRFQNITLVEDLVSNGYIVIGVDHLYTSNDVVFPDGTVAYRNQSIASSLTDVAFYEYEIDIRTEDIQIVLNELESRNASESIIKIIDRIDFDKIGFMGHSYGGATVAETLARDQRVKAGVSFDGGLWGTAAKQGVTQPFLYMSASQTLDYLYNTSEENNDYREFVSTVIHNLSSMYEKRSNDFYYVQLEDYNHYSFTDIPLISPLFKSGKGPIETTITYTETFFDQYLKGDDNMTLDKISSRLDYVNFQKNSDIVFPNQE